MPVNNNLEWTTIQDFAPGVYTVGEWLIPANAAQQMDNCYPQPGGGLRAWFKQDSITTTGITDISRERVLGIYTRGGIPLRSGAAQAGPDRYLLTYYYNSGATPGQKAQPRLYRMDTTNGDTTWSQILQTGPTGFAYATGDNNSPEIGSFTFFRTLTGAPNDQYVIMTLRYNGSDATIWKLNYNPAGSAQVAEKVATDIQRVGPIEVYQARLLMGQGGSVNPERLWYTNPGNLSIDGYIDVEPSQNLPGLTTLSAQPPSALLVGKQGAPWVSLQGEITDPVTYQLAPGRSTLYQIQDMAATPYGEAFIEPTGALMLTDGRTFNNISEQLAGSTWPQNITDVVGSGNSVYVNDFLFAPQGMVFDFRTRSWFKQTAMVGSLKSGDPYFRQLLGNTQDGTNFGIGQITPYDGTARVSSYTWKSAPFRRDDGRQACIREVQVFFESYAANSQITVTVGGVTQTQTGIPVGKSMRSFLFKAQGAILDVTVTPAHTAGTSEAPSIEAVRIGLTDLGHRLYQSAG